jgi:branched-chain amino acid transport system permease protein
MGSLFGALLAALLMLVVENVTAVVWSPVWSTLVFYVILAAFLLFRPQGIFGKVAMRRQ